MLKPIRAVITGIDNLTPVLNKTLKSVESKGKAMSSFGKTASIGISLPLVGAGIAALKTANSFQDAMNTVESKTLATTGEMKALKEQSIELSKTSIFNPIEVMNGMKFLGMAGQTASEISQTIKASIDLAAATGTGLDRTADILTNIMGQFSIPIEQTSRAADILAATTSFANINMEQLAETLNYTGNVAGEFGATLQTTAMMTGIVGNLGIQGSSAGTAFRQLFSRLAAPPANTLKWLRRLNIETTETVDGVLNIKDPVKILTELHKALSKFDDKKKLGIMQRMFGQVPFSTLTGLVREMAPGRMFDKLEDRMDTFVGGAAQKMADIRMKGSVGTFKRFSDSIMAMAIKIADSGLMENVTSITEKITSLIIKFNDLPAPIKNNIINIGLFAAAIGPAVYITGTLLTSLSAIGKALMFIKSGLMSLAIMKFGGFGLIGPIIGIASIPLIVILYKNVKGLIKGIKSGTIETEKWKKGWVKLEETFKPVYNLFTRLFTDYLDNGKEPAMVRHAEKLSSIFLALTGTIERYVVTALSLLGYNRAELRDAGFNESQITRRYFHGLLSSREDRANEQNFITKLLNDKHRGIITKDQFDAAYKRGPVSLDYNRQPEQMRVEVDLILPSGVSAEVKQQDTRNWVDIMVNGGKPVFGY